MERIVKWSEIGIAAPGADTNILSSNISTRNPASWLRIYISPEAASVMTLVRIGSTTTKVEELNATIASAAPVSKDGTPYIFDVPAPSAEYGPATLETFTYNVRVTTNVAISFLHIEEHIHGVS